MNKLELIEKIQQSPIRYAYTEMFLLKKNLYLYRESFSVSNYAQFVKTMLEFLLSKVIEKDPNPQPTRFYNATSDRNKVFRTVSIDIFFKDGDELKMDTFKLIDINFMFEEINRIHIKQIKKRLSKNKINRKNMVVFFRFKKEEPVGTITKEEINYWNNFINRNDYKYFHSFIKTRKIDLLKKYSSSELEKNIRLNAMCLDGEILFFRKLMEKEILIDCAKYVNENYIRQGFDMFGNDNQNTSILHMLKTLDIKTLKIMEEDCLIYSLLNEKEWLYFYITKGEINWNIKRLEAHYDGFSQQVSFSQSKETLIDRNNYSSNINLLINNNMKEVVNFLTINELQQEVSQYLDVICKKEIFNEIRENQKERYYLLNEIIDKLLTFKIKNNEELIFNFKITKLINTHYCVKDIAIKDIEVHFENIKNKINKDMLEGKEIQIFFEKEISPFSYAFMGEFWDKIFFNYGVEVLSYIFNNNKESSFNICNNHLITDLKDECVINIKSGSIALNNLSVAKDFCINLMSFYMNKRKILFDEYIKDTKIKHQTYVNFLNIINKQILFSGERFSFFYPHVDFYYSCLNEQIYPIIKETLLIHQLNCIDNKEGKIRSIKKKI